MPNITNIQRYCIHDGPGIRTTVFFKGCPLNCLWCHNPENIAYQPELMAYADRCVGCGACAGACPQGCIRMQDGRPVFDRGRCVAYGACARACRFDALEIAGRAAGVDEIVAACLKDEAFYEQSGGGVTLSGGEVMAQDAAFLGALLRRLKGEGLHVAIDTCGHAPWAHFEAVLGLADLFLYDLKLLDAARHLEMTGQSNTLLLENLVRLARKGAALHIRMPLIAGVNDADGDIEAVAAFLRQNDIRPLHISLLPYHAIGAGKRARLGRQESAQAQGFAPPSPARLQEIAARLTAAGFAASVGG